MQHEKFLAGRLFGQPCGFGFCLLLRRVKELRSVAVLVPYAPRSFSEPTGARSVLWGDHYAASPISISRNSPKLSSTSAKTAGFTANPFCACKDSDRTSESSVISRYVSAWNASASAVSRSLGFPLFATSNLQILPSLARAC